MSKILVILWRDHFSFVRETWPFNIDRYNIPTLSIGAAIEDNDDYVVLASTIEKVSGETDVDAIVIYKNSILSSKEYGEIEITLGSD